MLSRKNWILSATGFIAVFISLLHIFLCIDVYDDIAAWYAPMTRAFARSQWHIAFDLSVPILNTTLAGLVSNCGIEPFRALVIVSCVFYIASIPLLYFILKDFLKKDEYAAWGCLLYVVAPKIIRFSCTGLLNPSKNFFIIAAVALILASAKRSKWIYTFLLGIVLAGLALARAETLIFVPLLVLWYAFFLYRKKETTSPKRLIRIFVHCLVITIIFFAFVSPRLCQSWTLTGVPVLDIRQAGYVTMVLPFSPKEYKSQVNVIAERKTKVANPKFKTGMAKIFKGVECFVRGAYTPYLILALLGIFLWWKKKELRAEGFMLFSLIAVNIMVLITISNSVRYYTLTLVMLLPFTFTGIKFLWDLVPDRKNFKYPLIAILTVVALLQIHNGVKKAIKRKYDYEYNIGQWLKSNKDKLYPTRKRLLIAGTQPQYPYWADATWLNISENPIQFTEQLPEIRKAGFVVLEEDQKDAIDILKKQKDFKLLKQIHPDVFVFVNTGRRK